MTTKQAKNIITDLKDNFEKDERKEVLQHMIDNNTDFEVGNYRFIDQNEIDNILKDELLADEYMLGCFTDWFIADICDLDIETVKKAQKAENYELLGALMAKNIDEVVEKFVSYDGYGHHFSHYDGSEKEVGQYYMFRIN